MGRASFSFRFVPYTHRWKKLGGIVVWEKNPKGTKNSLLFFICGYLWRVYYCRSFAHHQSVRDVKDILVDFELMSAGY